MANPVVLEYLGKYCKKYKVEDLKRKIVSSGYRADEVEEALDVLGLNVQEEMEKSASEEAKVEIVENIPNTDFKKTQPQSNAKTMMAESAVEAGKKPIFMKAVAIILVVLLANVAFFIFRYGNLNKGLTGFSVKEVLSNSYQSLSAFSRMMLIGQWVALIFILAAVYLRDKNLGHQQDEVSGTEFKKMNADDKGTDLDVLYNVLKEKKHLRVSTISKLFDVKKGIALEWCKILESGNLAIIDYPSSREPVVKLVVK